MNIAFIPVRGGSKSIPLKNIKLFCGKPLVYWNLLALESAKDIDKVVVATDSQEIKTTVLSFNFSKVMVYDRNSENASDTASTEAVMLEYLQVSNHSRDDLFLLVQATSPLTQAKDFTQAINLLKNSDADSLLTTVRTKRFYWQESGEPLNYDFTNRPRRQDFDGWLMENGAFYINKVGNILKDKNRLSGKVMPYEMAEFTAVEIDEEDDWLVAESLMRKHILNKPQHKNIKLFLSDVDGTLTDAGMYYGENGEEFKKFNTHDGKGFELLRNAGIKTGIITSENTQIVTNRAKKLKVDYLYQGLEHKGKLDIVKEICKELNISLDEVAYIGDDVNCKELLENVGIKACPANALPEIKNIDGIIQLNKSGGEGAVREFIDFMIAKGAYRNEKI